MEANQFIGLIKFFRNEDFLDKLCSGLFYCNSPEEYRLNNQEGIGDPMESCIHSYRLSRNDSEIVLEINGHALTGVERLTLHNSNNRDSWLHCWFELRIPSDQEALDSLNANIERMKKEFGDNFAFIPAPKLKPLVELIQKHSEHPLYCDSVKYSSNSSDWGNLCKSTKFSYQNEYRFLFGECNPHSLVHYEFSIPQEDIQELILKNSEIKLMDSSDGTEWFVLRPNQLDKVSMV